MSFPHKWFAIFCLLIAATPVSYVQAQDAAPAKLWEDFNHYVLVARPDLAQPVAMKLTGLDPNAVLDAVEASNRGNLDELWERTEGMETLRETARLLRSQIQQARITRARDPDRIGNDIRNLGKDRRHYLNALERLRAAGQFAAPQLLSVLNDPNDKKLHPFVMSAMVDIGQPMVYPLSEALPQLEPVPQGQVAQVLGQIGYPAALPYMAQVLEAEGGDPHVRMILESARGKILKNVSGVKGVNAAEIFYNLAMNQYDGANYKAELAGYDDSQDKGIVWEYSDKIGLVPIPVPGNVYGDVLAMRSSAKALKIQPGMDKALTMWVMSNLRRNIKLNGEQDPSYAASRQAPLFYAELAGPARQHEILTRALYDQDAELALDAIEALGRTAGPVALLNLEGTTQPLIESLSYPDRRVRYTAAFTLTNARPKSPFPGSFRVVPVLAQAVRQSDERYAVVIAEDNNALNVLNAAVKEMGYQPVSGLNMAQIAPQMQLVPGIDVIITQTSDARFVELHRMTLTDYKLAAVPMVALTTRGGQIKIGAQFSNDPRVLATVAAPVADELLTPVEAARKQAVGQEVEGEEAAHYALTALMFLREIALTGGGDVYNITDAQPALLAALNDERDDVSMAASGVLALIDNEAAQQGIAKLALNETRVDSVRLAALASLGESFNQFGNKVTDQLNTDLRRLVANSSGELAVGAARAVGAGLPSSPQAVELIIK